MTKSTAVCIGAVAVLLVVGTVYMTNTRDAANESDRVEIVDVANGTRAELRAGPDEALKATVESLTDDLGRANKRIAELEDALMAATQTVEHPEPVEPVAEKLPEEQRQKREKKEGAQAYAFYIDKAYGNLFNELELSRDVEATARELFYDALVQRKTVAGSALESGDWTAREVKEQSDEITEQLRADLSTVLSDDEMAQWEEYEANRDWLALEQAFDGKLAAISPGLTEENRQVAREVIVEEHILSQDAFYQSDTPYTKSSLTSLQAETAQYARERLAGFLPEDQYTEVDRLLILFELHSANAQQNEERRIEQKQ